MPTPFFLVTIRSTAVLGHEVSMPVMIAPAALGKLLHPDGEKITVTAAKGTKVLQVCLFPGLAVSRDNPVLVTCRTIALAVTILYCS